MSPTNNHKSTVKLTPSQLTLLRQDSLVKIQGSSNKQTNKKVNKTHPLDTRQLGEDSGQLSIKSEEGRNFSQLLENTRNS